MASFKEAFAAARKAGKKTFTWNGKKYTTEMKSSGGSKSSGNSSTRRRTPKPIGQRGSTPKTFPAKPSPKPTPIGPRMKPGKPTSSTSSAGRNGPSRGGPVKTKPTSSTSSAGRNGPSRAGGSSKPKSPAQGGLITSKTQTKGGTYPTFKKDSAIAKDFRSAFANARKAGKKTFSWDGRKYSTKTK